jgi:hypothetical protein
MSSAETTAPNLDDLNNEWIAARAAEKGAQARRSQISKTGTPDEVQAAYDACAQASLRVTQAEAAKKVFLKGPTPPQPPQPDDPAGADSITVLKAHDALLTKRISPGKEPGEYDIKPYDKAYLFDVRVMPVNGLDDAEPLLKRLRSCPRGPGQNNRIERKDS